MRKIFVISIVSVIALALAARICVAQDPVVYPDTLSAGQTNSIAF